jgi:hypothetical protein
MIAADYIEYGNTKYVATAQNNHMINFWDPQSYIHRDRIATSDIQLSLKWCGSGPNYNVNRLFSAGCDYWNGIHCYDITTLKDTTILKDEKEKIN